MHTVVCAMTVDTTFVCTKFAGSKSVCAKVARTTGDSPPGACSTSVYTKVAGSTFVRTNVPEIYSRHAQRNYGLKPFTSESQEILGSGHSPRTRSGILGSAVHLGVAANLGLRPFTADRSGMSN